MNGVLDWLGKVFLAGALITTSNSVRFEHSSVGSKHGALPVLSSAPAANQVAALPCDMGKIAFDSLRDFDAHGEIYVMNADGSNQTRLTTHTAIDLHPSWSPDGSTIAFQSDRDSLENGRSDIYLMNADGTNVRRLTTNPAFDEAPAWSPDGNRIAFLSTRDDVQNGIRQLYVMNADGTGQMRVPPGISVESPISWSPDGTKLAFSAPQGSISDASDIFILNAGGTITRLTAAAIPGEHYTAPAWSPNGQQLALTQTLLTFRDAEVFVINADGSGLKNLTNAPGHDTEPTWAPDGSAIAFVGSRSGTRQIYSMYVDGSNQTRLTNNSSFDDRPAWLPVRTTVPCLLTESDTERAVALQSVVFTRDPFTVVTDHNLGTDRRTRIMLFCRNLKLLSGDDPSDVTVVAEDAQQRVIPLTVEFIGQVNGFDWLTQVNVSLPDELQGAGDVRISVRFKGEESNKALVNIAGLSA